MSKNVSGTALECCCLKPRTGFYRDGFCKTGAEDVGTHVVCSVMTQEFLDFTLTQGNDLITPNLLYDFPGLKPGDKWCLCVLRWKQAWQVGVAPLVILEATHEKALQVVSLTVLEEYALKV
ncbi:MAG: DUF2237 domain-containing protein [Verrucomicrobia bacterium]|nr:DUF2237 domain-containing protein [Cytophagales bacterium]